jgi:hypothetical protein
MGKLALVIAFVVFGCHPTPQDSDEKALLVGLCKTMLKDSNKDIAAGMQAQVDCANKHDGDCAAFNACVDKK